MVETTNESIQVYRDALSDDNVSVQVDAIKRLSIFASTLNSKIIQDELIPLLNDSVSAIHDEASYHLAEEITKIVDKENRKAVVEVLIQLSGIDETLVRNKAIASLRTICDNLTTEECETTFFPFIEQLVTSDWFSRKCSAGFLIPICYTKLTPEKQTNSINFFRILIQDDQPMVRRSTATSLTDFIPLIAIDTIKSEFVPIFDNLSLDEEDSVRTLSVDVGVALSKNMKDFEIYDFLINTFKSLVEDQSWHIRRQIALKIAEIPLTEKTRDEFFSIFSKLARDKEAEVRIHVAKNVYEFSQNFIQTYTTDLVDDKFVEILLPEIQQLLKDEHPDVRVALSTNILSISIILSNDCFIDNILPLIIDAIENEDNMSFKENMLKNLNSLPDNVNIAKSLSSIQDVIFNLIDKSETHWRTRRNLLVAFMHITRNTNSEYFDTNLKVFYQMLLNDQIYAIRRVAPLILPILIKRFGVSWAKTSLFPIFVPFATDSRYLHRFVTLFAIEELVNPTLDDSGAEKNPLKHFEALKSKESIEALVRIIYLNSQVLSGIETLELATEYVDDNLKLYAEDTLDNLRKNAVDIFHVSSEEVDDSYLEGVLFMLVKDFLKVLIDLSNDSTGNVKDRALLTLSKVRTFSLKIEEESKEDWVLLMLNDIDSNEIPRIRKEVDDKLLHENIIEEIIEMTENDENNDVDITE